MTNIAPRASLPVVIVFVSILSIPELIYRDLQPSILTIPIQMFCISGSCWAMSVGLFCPVRHTGHPCVRTDVQLFLTTIVNNAIFI